MKHLLIYRHDGKKGLHMVIRAIRKGTEITHLRVKKVSLVNEGRFFVGYIRFCRPERIESESLIIDEYLYDQTWVKQCICTGVNKVVILGENDKFVKSFILDEGRIIHVV